MDVTYAELAASLEYRFGGSIDGLDLILDSCFSGSALESFQGRGFDGTIVTSADANSLCWARGHNFFTSLLFTAWNHVLSSSGTGGLGAAFDHVLRHSSSIVAGAGPQKRTLHGTPRALTVPTLHLTAAGGAVRVRIPSPKEFKIGDSFPTATKVVAPSIASVSVGSFVNGVAPVLTAQGLTAGSTTYSVMVRGTHAAYRGTGAVQVRPRLVRTPPSPRPF